MKQPPSQAPPQPAARKRGRHPVIARLRSLAVIIPAALSLVVIMLLVVLLIAGYAA